MIFLMHLMLCRWKIFKNIEATDASISKTKAEQKAVEAQYRKTNADAYKQEMDNDYQKKTGIPLNGSLTLPAKVLRDAAPIFKNAAEQVERSHPVEDRFKVPFGSYQYGPKNNSEVVYVSQKVKKSFKRHGLKKHVRRKGKRIKKYGVSRGGIRL